MDFNGRVEKYRMGWFSAGFTAFEAVEDGACVTRPARRIHVALSSAYPNQNLFMHVWRRLTPS